MEPNISIRIYMNQAPDRWLHQVLKIEAVSHCDSARQIDVQVVYHDVEFDKLDGKLCREFACPDGPELHKHDYFSTAVIRAESRE